MKKTFSSLYLIIISFGIVVLPACNNTNHETAKIETIKTVKSGDQNQTKAVLNIEGMTCEVSCAGYINKKLNGMNGVLSAEVLFEKNQAIVQYDETKLTEKDLISEIEKLNEGQYKITRVEVEKTIKKEAA